jgi:hypothetical protein
MNGYLDALARLSHLAFGHTVSKEFWSRLRTSLYRRVHGDAGHGETGGQSEGDEEGLGRHELRSSAPMRNGEVESCVVGMGRFAIEAQVPRRSCIVVLCTDGRRVGGLGQLRRRGR